MNRQYLGSIGVLPSVVNLMLKTDPSFGALNSSDGL